MISLKSSSLIKPAEPTPNGRLWVSEPDLLQPITHSPLLYFYRPNTASNFFSPQIIKSALSRALVQFYPLAGRLRHDEDGRIELECNAAGVTFVEAESDAKIDDFGDFKPAPELRNLFPYVDYNTHVGEWPLLLVQLTVFSCNGVCLALAFNHTVLDSLAFTEFVSFWAGIARGGTTDMGMEVCYDRTLLRARRPPVAPAFEHEEFKPPPRLIVENNHNEKQSKETAIAMVKLSREQVNSIRRAAGEGVGGARYSRFESLAGHVWRCVCMARRLRDDQPLKLYMTVNMRTRLSPPLPVGYLGNAVLLVAAVARSGDLVSNSVSHSASRIRKEIEKIDDKYLRSVLDFLSSQMDLGPLQRGFDLLDADPVDGAYHGTPNLMLTSWLGIRIYDADFGWGPPMHMGPALVGLEGRGFIIPASEGDGSVVVALHLEAELIKPFMDLVYEPTVSHKYSRL